MDLPTKSILSDAALRIIGTIIMCRLRMRSEVYGSVSVCRVLQLFNDKMK